MKTEQWKVIEGYARYEVSDHGRIRNTETGRILKLHPHSAGYLCQRLQDEDGRKSGGKMVHRLVAHAFIPNPQEKPQVNHRNLDKRNNAVYNLEWVTAQENMEHAEAMESKAWARFTRAAA